VTAQPEGRARPSKNEEGTAYRFDEEMA